MADAAAPGEGARPALAPGVRLRFDDTRQAWLLLAPERIIETEGPTQDILSRCDGVRTIGEIIDALAGIYAADRAEIAADVLALVGELAAKRLVRL
ncbi:MAG: pyrroloquinoline quinone biosynthesis peptide chaperone PqqD [Rhodospirillales bacterium]|jgi:pyrroloquinoline quinone biosynthesis protein D|nr:pyrroloquinoline quinone biosynthesis peptide chaperone PqqD [Rhodospirillales bacterium]